MTDERETAKPDRLTAVERRVNEHSRRIGALETDIGEMRAFLGDVATKSDVADLRAQIDSSVNNMLRDALNSIPAWHAAMLGVLAALATAALLLMLWFGKI